MTLLVTGAGGQVGSEAAALCRARGLPVAALARADLDIADPGAVAAAMAAHAPRVVVNAAAHTDVDGAEADPDRAMAVNRDGAAHLAAACAGAGIPLLHLSTDYVFDGELGRPYREDDAPAPLNAYGRSKLAGEAAVRAAGARHLILRVSWVFAAHGRNFVRTMLGLAERGVAPRVVADRHGCPTPAAAVSAALVRVAEEVLAGGEPPWGTYHFGGQPPVSWYAFARRIFDLAAEDGLLPAPVAVTPIQAADYLQPAARPRDPVLDCAKWAARFGPPPDWQAGLAAVLTEIAAARR